MTYERRELEKYYTPAWAIEALREAEGAHLHDHKTVFDPCAGDGAVLNCFANSLGMDVAPDRDDIIAGDFLATDGRYDAIVTNPPYGQGGRLAVSFIERALEQADYVAMLLRVDFDSASTRRHLFADNERFAVKYALTKRLRWTNIKQADSGPSTNHAWFVWRKNKTFPRVGYLP
jgi:predicted RNA methylase